MAQIKEVHVFARGLEDAQYTVFYESGHQLTYYKYVDTNKRAKKFMCDADMVNYQQAAQGYVHIIYKKAGV